MDHYIGVRVSLPRLFTAGRPSGFTLVELAIILVIIGLLIGGLIKGAAIIESAQEKDLIRAISEIRTATVLFRDNYGAMPGDLSDAMARIPGCSAAALCEGGDGNGLVASDGTDVYEWLSPIGNSGMAREAAQFWKHLALADMISGVATSANPDEPSWGLTHPHSPLGGGFEFYHDAYIGDGARGGHILRLSANGLAAATFAGSEIVRGAVNPRQASRIDLLIDDGNPSSGLIVADYGVPSNECKDIVSGVPLYRENELFSACILYIHIGQ